MLVPGANRQHNCRGSEELAILETAGSGLAARSFWECSEQLGVLGVLGVARNILESWAPSTRSSSEQLGGLVRSSWTPLVARSSSECSELKTGSTKLPAIPRELGTSLFEALNGSEQLGVALSSSEFFLGAPHSE